MLQVLVSSTFANLRTERDVVRTQIERLSKTHEIEWIGMEAFGSLASAPLEASTGHTAQADLIVLLIGGQYGSVPPDEEKSFTQHEFETAVAARIPCLAYFAPAAAEASDPRLRSFLELVRREITPATFSDSEDLARRVASDLERELSGVINVELTDIPTKGPVRVRAFVNRRDELSLLHEQLAHRKARVAIVGGPGMGKTALMSQYLQEARRRRHDPLWLQMDALLGRLADGKKILGARRVGYDSLRRMIADHVKARSRALVIFDNAQADPRGTRWLASCFPDVKICCLTWDLRAVPSDCELVKLPLLREGPAIDLLRSYCSPAQAYDEPALHDLAVRLDGYPLALDLVGRRLQHIKGLNTRDLQSTLQGSEGFLDLEGPTPDKTTVTIRTVIKGNYQCLDTLERKVLTALAAVPSKAYSDQTVSYLLRVLSPGKAGLERSLELGLVDLRLDPDWRGHRYSMRDAIREYLRTDSSFFSEGETVVQHYLRSTEVFADTSVDVVGDALEAQFADGKVLRKLLLDSPQPMRSAVRRRLSSLAGGPHQTALEDMVAMLLAEPHRTGLTLELLELLSSLKSRSSAAMESARRLWIRPAVSSAARPADHVLDPDVQVAAGRVLACGEQLEFSEWLGIEASSDNPDRVERALEAAGRAFLPDMLSYCQRALKSSSRKLRRIGASAFAAFAADYREHREFELDRRIRDSLWQMVGDESDDELRLAAAHSLAMWGDERCLTYWETKFASADPEERNRGVINVRQFSVAVRNRYQREFDFTSLLDRMADLSASDPSEHVRVHATLVLIEADDPRSATSIIHLLEDGGEYGGKLALGFVPTIVDFLEETDQRRVADAVAHKLHSEDEYLSAWARRALLELRDNRGLDNLWEFLKQGGIRESPNRWHVLSGLRRWTASEIESGRLRPFLHDADPRMRASAAQVAGETHMKDLVDDLESLVEDTAPLPAAFAAKAVGEVALTALDRILGRMT